MNLESLGKTVAKYAPLLGAVLPIPGGAAIGQAVASIFGGDINNTDDLIAKINNDPEAEVKLKQIESNQKIELEKLAVQKLQIASEDVENARERQIELSKTPLDQRDRTPETIAKYFLTGYFGVVILNTVALWTGSITAEELAPLNQMLKDMGMAVMLILTFFFGGVYKSISKSD